MVGTIRFIALVLIALSYFLMRLRKKKEHKVHSTHDELKNFKKNEEGLYPWEADTNDSPNRIPANAKRYVNKAKLKRGRW
ncbi:hypothetical protein IGI39_003727 [Enterococcus sp. AZ135]|uniref:hypothetical protein n=1 Tax=unclassified Enterococcus TaxID=2608891 RepID=UPI003F276170